jgi:S-DNA-T family DNA segregation ATPase FtsK/SpoIIIE
MLVTLIKKDRIYSTFLPEKVSGQFWISDVSGSTQSRQLLSIEAVSGTWQIRSKRNARVIGAQRKEVRSAALEPGGFYTVRLLKEKDTALLFAEEITQGRLAFEKFVVAAQQGVNITVGRNIGNTIVYDNKYVSGTHATLQFLNGRWSITDHDSENGTFVNHLAVRSSPLKPGDVVYILGLVLLIGGNFLAVNNPSHKVKLDSRLFQSWAKPTLLPANDDEPEDEQETEYFYRSPRFKREIAKAEFSIDAPPQPNAGNDMPLMMVLGPSITMGMASVATGAFSVVNAMQNGNVTQAIPSIVMASSMLLGTIMWPILSRQFEKKRKAKREALRQEKYSAYLDAMAEKIKAECANQEAILHENHIPVAACKERVLHRRINLWERTAEQNDFLRLRVGLGTLPLEAEVKIPEKKFSLDDDNLENKLYALRDEPKLLQDVPITVSLLDNAIASVIGRRKKCVDFAHGLTLQLAALYGYDEVKLVFLYDEAEDAEFGYVKWLPHAWNDDKTFRFVATNAGELKELSVYLEKEMETRQALEEQALQDVAPYYVIFACSRALSLRTELLKKLFAADKNLRMSVVCLFDELKNVPKECSTVLELKVQGGRIFDKKDTSGVSLDFINDVGVGEGMRDIALTLANIPLDLAATAYQLPKMITFLELFGVGMVEHLNPLMRWHENDPTKSLQAAVGVNTLGDTFTLDLHEKFHGPHGLVAGMTGSGKSEFIITYILSLAVNYHPNEVAFILIDYKGGGMAKSFEHLPHTAGIITNLDGAAINRSLVSIQSELKHRQAVFNEAAKQIGVSNIDIYKYQKAFRDGQVSEPLPHLFIISDEFAELKTQQPEFMTQLVSAARIGRSLGIHLILATQKPAGVVDDQIWSNSRFKVCLKVQDRADSMDMLKRPDAAELKETGRFYLQVGYNELFELGQSAWAGAPYYPAETIEVEDNTAISVIDMNGHAIQSVKLERRKGLGANPPKQLDAITDYLSGVATEEGIATRQLWLPPIAPVILLHTLEQTYSYTIEKEWQLCPLVGELDDPTNQGRLPLYLPLSGEGNAILYGSAGNGKATFLTTLLFSLLSHHNANALHAYILDFGAETLRNFSQAPQVGDVIFSSESEKVINLLKLLKSEVAARKKIFAEFGGDYASHCEHSGQVAPNILLVINNYSAFQELYDDYEDSISYLAMEGTKYGIYLVLTATSTSAVRYRIAQNFKQLLVLQLNDDTEYSGVLGNTGGVLPSHSKGRGIVKLGEVFEFQTAYAAPPEEVFAVVRRLCADLSESWQGERAPKVPILPEKCDADFLADTQAAINRFPIGVNKHSLAVEYIDLTANFITFITANDGDLLPAVLEGIAEVYPVHSVTDEAAVIALKDLMVERHNALKAAPGTAFERQVYMISGVFELFSALSEDGAHHLTDLLANGRPELGIHVLLGETVANLQSYTIEPWYRNQWSGNGIWVGDGAADQFMMKLNGSTNDLRGDMGRSFGAVIHKGKYKLVKLLQSRAAAQEDAE